MMRRGGPVKVRTRLEKAQKHLWKPLLGIEFLIDNLILFIISLYFIWL